jgi:hypothetical protein
MTTAACLDAALTYAERGWLIFHADGKVPFKGTHGSTDATTNETTIRRWWHEHPYANVVIVTGEASGLTVLDVDMHGHDGKATLKALWAQYGAPPPTPVSNTGGGGMHLLFAFSAAVKRGPVEGQPGLEFVNWFVAPPSMHPSGKQYEWHPKYGPDTPLAPVPDWLVEMVKAARTPNRAGVDGTALRLERGQRDIRLYHEGCALRGRGYPEEAIYEALLAVNRWCCEPPLPESVVRTKAHSAAQHPLGVARPAGKTLQSVEMPP